MWLLRERSLRNTSLAKTICGWCPQLDCKLHAEKNWAHVIFVTSHGATSSTRKYTITTYWTGESEPEISTQYQIGMCLHLGSPRSRRWSQVSGANYLFKRGILFLLLLWQITTNLVVQNRHIYYLTVLEVTGPKRAPMGSSQGVGRDAFFMKRNPFLCLFQLLEATYISWFVAPFAIFKGSRVASSILSDCFCYHIFSESH